MVNYSGQQQSPNAAFKTLTIIYFALLAGQLMFAAVVLSLLKKVFFSVQYSGDPLLYIVPVMAIGGIMAGDFLFKQQIEIARKRDTLSSKLTVYQTAIIIRCALLEGASLFGIVATLLSGNLFFLMVSAFIILYFLSFRPTKDKLKNLLQLTYEEELELGT